MPSISTIIYGAIGAVGLGLLALIGYYHFIEVPHLESSLKITQQQVSIEKAKNDVTQADVSRLQEVINNQNAQVKALGEKCLIADQKAELAAKEASLHVFVPKPVTSTIALTEWLDSLKTSRYS